MTNSQTLFKLLQLVSPALPVGAYSYSEGLEALVQAGTIDSSEAMIGWLQQELAVGLIRVEAGVVGRVHDAAIAGNRVAISEWNDWLSAIRETEEVRQQSWAMGRALGRLAAQIQPDIQPSLEAIGTPCNFAVGFGLLAARWEIDAETTVLGYLHSWVSNLITSAVKLIPLGQTTGQQLLLELYPRLEAAAQDGLAMEPADLALSGWGASLASMHHEELYSRLFRS